jgi:thiamine transporter
MLAAQLRDITGMRVHSDRLCELTDAATAVGLSVLLGNLRLLELPQGGSISCASLPILVLAIVRGPALALRAGACAGIANALTGGTIVHPAQLGLDYLLAGAVLAIAGMWRATKAGIAAGITLAMIAQLAVLTVSGMIFFAQAGAQAALVYSISYNAIIVVPELVLALLVIEPLVRAMQRATPSLRARRALYRRPPLIQGSRTQTQDQATTPTYAPPPEIAPTAQSVRRPAMQREPSLVRPAPFTTRRRSVS